MATRKKAAALATIKIPTAEPVAEAYQRDAEALVLQLRTEPLAVRSDRHAEQVGEIVSELGAQKAELTRMLRSITDPINKGLKQARALFQPAIKSIESAERPLRAALGEYRVRQLEAAAASREAAAVAAEAGDTDALMIALETPDPVQSDAATSTRFRWVLAEVNEDLMPREWLTADVAKLNGLCRATSGQEDIMSVPGVTFRREAIVVRK